MERHILLTTDLSEEAERAFQPVRNLAELIDAKVTLLHVIQTLTPGEQGGLVSAPVAPVNPEHEETSAYRVLEEQREKLGDQIEVSLKVLTAPDVVRAVVNYAKEAKVGLIALSSHGRSGLRRLFLGSVAESILRHATMPVLTFPPSEEVSE